MIKSFQKGSTAIELIATLIFVDSIFAGVFVLKTVGGWVSCNNY